MRQSRDFYKMGLDCSCITNIPFLRTHVWSRCIEKRQVRLLPVPLDYEVVFSGALVSSAIHNWPSRLYLYIAKKGR